MSEKGLSGWLSPLGEWYPFNIFEDINMANKIIQDKNIASKYHMQLGQLRDEKLLLSHDYIKLTSIKLTDTYITMIVSLNPITLKDGIHSKQQLDWLKSHETELSTSQKELLFR